MTAPTTTPNKPMIAGLSVVHIIFLSVIAPYPDAMLMTCALGGFNRGGLQRVSTTFCEAGHNHDSEPNRCQRFCHWGMIYGQGDTSDTSTRHCRTALTFMA